MRIGPDRYSWVARHYVAAEISTGALVAGANVFALALPPTPGMFEFLKPDGAIRIKAVAVTLRDLALPAGNLGLVGAQLIVWASPEGPPPVARLATVPLIGANLGWAAVSNFLGHWGVSLSWRPPKGAADFRGADALDVFRVAQCWFLQVSGDVWDNGGGHTLLADMSVLYEDWQKVVV